MRNAAESSKKACGADLSGRKIILGITGSIAAYKSAYIASRLVQQGADVYAVMTEHAASLVGPATFWSLTSNPVLTGMFEEPKRFEIEHVKLPESADLMLIAPATANIIAKMAHGIADDMLSTMALVVRCPVIAAPAMNVNMWTSPVTQGNVEALKKRGMIFIEPESGRLACGDEGQGRLAEPDDIIRAVEQALGAGQGDYSGVKVVVSAGPTREPIDPVRFISNRSSGKMGYAMAAEAVARGADVTLVSGPVELEAPRGVRVVRVETVGEMLDAVKSAMKDADVFVSAAAPADFTPAHPSANKIKKSASLALDLSQAPDILAELGKHKGKKVLVGFAAETEKVEAHAVEKLKRKNSDLFVANDVSAGAVFGSDTNKVTLFSRTGDRIEYPEMPKRAVAKAILDYVRTKLLEGNR